MRAYNRDMVEVEIKSKYVMLPRWDVHRVVDQAVRYGLGTLEYSGTAGDIALAIKKIGDGEAYEVTLLDMKRGDLITEISSEEDMGYTLQATEVTL